VKGAGARDSTLVILGKAVEKLKQETGKGPFVGLDCAELGREGARAVPESSFPADLTSSRARAQFQACYKCTTNGLQWFDSQLRLVPSSR
jgi:hypothetical protein